MQEKIKTYNQKKKKQLKTGKNFGRKLEILKFWIIYFGIIYFYLRFYLEFIGIN